MPFNYLHKRKKVFNDEARFLPQEGFLDMSKEDWHEITEDVFKRVFKKSAVKRTKLKGFMRNLDFIK